jgi:hypothetical protein
MNETFKLFLQIVLALIVTWIVPLWLIIAALLITWILILNEK